MSDTYFTELEKLCNGLGISLSAQEAAVYTTRLNINTEELEKMIGFFGILKKEQDARVVETCIRLSRLPKEHPKTFANFDYFNVHMKYINRLKNLETLAPLYEHRNIAFIGPQGIGKTHLAQAFGNGCCEKGLKTYFIKATELNAKLLNARKNGTADKAVNGLVKPSCLIIDEMGRCSFDRENTRLFFDIVDRRYSKEGPNNIIFTSNKSPNMWKEDFDEDDSLLCALDRAFDDATVFMMDGDSYRGRKLETIAVKVGGTSSLLKGN